jgi:ArsR family transcriptional regulator
MRMTEAPSPLDVRPTSGLLKALADDTRLRIVALLSRGELCVCHIASSLDLSQPNASQHLTVLRNAGVVDSRRQGSWIYYRMTGEQDPVRARILRAILDGFADLAAAAEDRRRLAATREGVTCE